MFRKHRMYVNEHGDVFDLPHAKEINAARMELLLRYLRDKFDRFMEWMAREQQEGKD